MRRTAALLLAGPLALAVLAGCSDDSAPEPVADPTTPASSASARPGPVVVEVPEDGEDSYTATVSAGEQVSVALATCGGCGFAWSVAAPPDPEVAVREETPAAAEQAPSAAASGEPLVGVPTTTTYVFRGGAPGSTSISFDYDPPTGDAPERTVVLALEVTGEATALPALEDATRVVTDLYAQEPGQLQSASREELTALVTPELADLLEVAAAEAAGEVGRLDVDPLYGAQDVQVTGLRVQPALLLQRTAAARVGFTNLGEATEVAVRLEPVADGWRVSDVEYPDGRTLAGILRG